MIWPLFLVIASAAAAKRLGMSTVRLFMGALPKKRAWQPGDGGADPRDGDGPAGAGDRGLDGTRRPCPGHWGDRASPAHRRRPSRILYPPLRRLLTGFQGSDDGHVYVGGFTVRSASAPDSTRGNQSVADVLAFLRVD